MLNCSLCSSFYKLCSFLLSIAIPITSKHWFEKNYRQEELGLERESEPDKPVPNISLLNDPSFAQIHLCRQLFPLHQYLNNDDTPNGSSTTTVSCGGGVEFGFILGAVSRDAYGCEVFWYGKYDENDKQSYKMVKRINHPTSINISGFTMVGSCNGLICLLSVGNVYGDPTYIFNPITREYINLPRSFSGKSVRRDMISGFGYHSSINEYKVVKICYSDREENLGQVQVYTLGTGSGWRDKGEVAYSFWSTFGRMGIHASGKLHWLVDEGIIAFDLEDEEFHFIPSPPIGPIVYFNGQMDKYDKEYRLCELGGLLGFAHHVLSEMGTSSHVDIWLLKKNSTTIYNMNEKEHECWGWSKEFTIPRNDYDYGGNDDYISLLGLTKRGEVLFWDFDNEDSLCRYDPKSATIEKHRLNDSTYITEVIPHINSFVSLKALGESLTEE